ncbi:MAG TPA: TonB-dependent receptor, partial [Thermoanaerobaculia bacterium]|nr:TonB-dependent receptor [Thermoanaerobaculia bacterium]
MNATRCACVLLILLCFASAMAQMTTGSVVGTVTSEGAPLPGVTVTATSPSLQGSRTAVSGEGGGFFLPNLAPGSYKLTFELAGMERVEKRVTVSVSQTSRADTAMRLSAVAEQITVTAAVPIAAAAQEIAANFESEQINQLPVDRTIDSVVRLAPGVTEAGPNNQITISGATSFDNLFLVNGVVVNENLRGQPTPLYIEDAVQETTVLSGGISAEFGRFTGGVVSTITKSGGNEFSGSLRDSLSNPNWSSKTAFADQVDPLDEINSVYEATLGGRILTDRLWFFTSGRTQSTEQSRQTTQTNIPFTSTTDDNRYEAKLTGQVTPRHSLVGSYTNSHNEIDKSISSGSVVDLRSLTPYDRPRSIMSFNYNGVLSDKVLIEGQFSRMNDKFTNGANDRDLINGTLLMDVSTRRRMWSPTFCGAPCPPKER